MSELVVYLAGARVGRLIRRDNGNLQFRYEEGYAGPPVSQSMPVQPDRSTGARTPPAVSSPPASTTTRWREIAERVVALSGR